MLKTTFVARASDGLILCETYDSNSTEQSKYPRRGSDIIL